MNWLKRRKSFVSFLLAAAVISGFLLAPLPAFAADEIPDLPEAVFNIYGTVMDRGVIAAKVSNGVFLAWRYFPEEATGVSDTGLVGADFAVFKNGEKIADVTDSTDFLDPNGTVEDTYVIVTVQNGVYTSRTEEIQPAAQTSSGSYLSIPLQRPPSIQAPSNTNASATVTKNYMQDEITVGDVDGDGQLEYVVKWLSDDPDVTGTGYCAPVIFQCYKLDGTKLWEINLGVNIRSGKHYSQPMLYDFDGDGKAEFMTKTAPGTKDGLDNFITMPQADIEKGYTHADDYRDNDGALNGGGVGTVETREQGKRFQWVVNFFKTWQEQGDVVDGYWKYPPQVMLGLYQAGYVGVGGVAVESDGIMGSYKPYPSAVGYTQEVWDRLNALPKNPEAFKNYTITDRDALDLAWLYWANIFDWSSTSGLNREVGFVIEGPEYFTVFEGATGKELDTIPYAVPRDDIGILWNDMTTMNRNDRHLGGVAYLDGDGANPSCIQVRGYYSRTTVSRYDWDGLNLTSEVMIDSGYQVTNNPFRTGDTGPADPLLGPGGLQGNPGRNEASFDPENPTVEKLELIDKEHFSGPSITDQGFHSLSVMDVDRDGFDEIILGNVTLNHDGSVRYSTYYQTYTQGTNETTPTGKWEKAQHGDSMHVAYFEPEQTAPKFWGCLESALADEMLKNADTGEVLYFSQYGNATEWLSWRDNGRAIVGKFTTEPGWQLFTRARVSTPLGTNVACGLRKSDGSISQYQTLSPGTDASIFWSADMTTQIVGGTTNVTVQKLNADQTAFAGILTTSGTRSIGGKPSLAADVLGDYREELILIAGTAVTQSPELRVYFNTEESGHKMASLYTDRRYRVETSRQWTCYNQPTYPSFYYGPDIIWKVYADSIGVDDLSDGKVRVSLSGDSAITGEEDAEYVLSAANLNKLATVTVWFDVDGKYFAGKDVLGLNGFDVLGDIVWTAKDDSIWSGRVTLTNLDGGVSGGGYLALLKLTLSAKGELGETDVKITRIDLSGYDGENNAVYLESVIRNGEVRTRIAQHYSLYDVNRDTEVNQLDLTTAQKYYMAAAGDPNWADAKASDVNGDGRVDIEDLILILNHIVW